MTLFLNLDLSTCRLSSELWANMARLFSTWYCLHITIYCSLVGLLYFQLDFPPIAKLISISAAPDLGACVILVMEALSTGWYEHKKEQ